MLATALGGGLAYQLGTWNTNDGRLGLYVEGMKAINCAKAALVPLQLDEVALTRAETLQVEVGNQLKVAARAGGTVLSAISEVARTRAAGSSPTGLETTAQAELASLVTTLNDANNSGAQAAGLRLRVQGASHNFGQTIDRIRTTVNAAIKGTLADLSKLPEAIAGFSRYASAVVPGVLLDPARSAAVVGLNQKIAGTTTATPNAQAANRLREQAPQDPFSALAQALGTMQSEQRYLAWLISRLKGAVEVSTTEQVKSRLEGCGIDTKVVPALSVARSALSFVAGSAGVETVIVAGGTLPYSASWAGLPHTGMSVTLTAGSVLVIAAGTDSVAGQTHTLNVTDASGTSARIVVAIGEAAAATKAVTKDGGAPTSQAAMSCLGSWHPAPEALCFVQARVGTTVDGRFGIQSCKAYAAHSVATRHGSAPNPDGLADLVKEAGLPTDASSTVLGAWLVRQRLTQCGKAQLPTVEKAEEILATGTFCKPKRAACPVEGAQCDLECTLTEGQMTQLRRQLNVPAGKGFDKPLRDALRQLAPDILPGNAEGQYTPAVANFLERGRKATR